MIVGSIVGGLAAAVGTLVGRVLVSLGVSFVVYNGVDTMVEWVRDQVMAKFSLLPPDVYTVISLLQAPAIVNVYFSAWLATLAISGLQAGTFVKAVQRVPGSVT
jgi:hypothetical protein